MKRICVLALVAAAMFAGESQASCGLLSRLFGGRRVCGSAKIEAAPCQQCQPKAEQPNNVREYPVKLPDTCPDCPSGNCPQVKPARRFSLFGR